MKTVFEITLIHVCSTKVSNYKTVEQKSLKAIKPQTTRLPEPSTLWERLLVCVSLTSLRTVCPRSHLASRAPSSFSTTPISQPTRFLINVVPVLVPPNTTRRPVKEQGLADQISIRDSSNQSSANRHQVDCQSLMKYG